METLKTKPLMLSVCSKIRDMNEKRNIDKKNLGKIVLKTELAFFGLNSVKITGVLRTT